MEEILPRHPQKPPTLLTHPLGLLASKIVQQSISVFNSPTESSFYSSVTFWDTFHFFFGYLPSSFRKVQYFKRLPNG